MQVIRNLGEFTYILKLWVIVNEFWLMVSFLKLVQTYFRAPANNKLVKIVGIKKLQHFRRLQILLSQVAVCFLIGLVTISLSLRIF